MWPSVTSDSGGYNKTGLGLALLALYEIYSRPGTATSPPTEKTKSAEPATSFPFLTASLPLGSLIFTLHSLLSDPSTLIAWSWTGYSDARPRGPLPHVHGSLTLVTQCAGFLLALGVLSSPNQGLFGHPLWFLYGAASTYGMYTYKDWLGYLGGLNMALFTMSIIPVVLHRSAVAARTTSVGKVYSTAMLVYCLLGLANIWTVAYAFVPGGVYLRERTDL